MSDTAKGMMGPNLDPDKFLSSHAKWAAAESSAASAAGERRQEIGALVDNMRLENKAASQARAILKIKNEGKRRDAVRSWQQILPMLEREILQETEDMFPANGTEDEAAVEPADDYDPTDMEPGPHEDEDVDPINFDQAAE